jgi:hypothetical protein
MNRPRFDVDPPTWTIAGRRRAWLAPGWLALLGTAGCLSHDVSTKPIEIKPIHITMDINLKVQRELEEFFDFEREVEKPTNASAEPNKDPVPNKDKEQR